MLAFTNERYTCTYYTLTKKKDVVTLHLHDLGLIMKNGNWKRTGKSLGIELKSLALLIHHAVL